MKKYLVLVAILFVAASCNRANGPAENNNTGENEPTGYTMSEIATHNSEASCWVAVRGNVYDLTEWIAQHPGGPDRIKAICGTDATANFLAQHGTQPNPNTALASFQIGVLAE